MHARTRAVTTMRSGNRSTRSVLIGIPTFRRPRELERLLAALPAVVAAVREAGAAGSVDILVVDNADDPVCRAVVAAARGDVGYLVERRRGVTCVRNRILDESSGHDLLVFIDDDETPRDAQWLCALLETFDRSRAHLVAGPVVTVSDADLDPWIVAGGFFAREHRQGLRPGSPIRRAASNNMLLDRAYLDSVGVRFDDRFGRTGGEDSLFTSQLSRAGARMRWDDRAVVLDHLPETRRTRAHALRRTRHLALADVRVELALADSRRDRVRVRARKGGAGAARLLLGCLGIAAGLTTGSMRWQARGRRHVARAVGAISGVLGQRPLVYGGDDG